MTNIYSPSTSLPAKINRRLIPYRAKRNLSLKLDNPLISLTFDDCPKSVVDNALPLIEQEGWQATLYMSMGLCGTTNHLGLHMSESDVTAAHASGHEIADHTFSHIDVTTVSKDEFEKNVDKNQEKLNELGLPPSKTFAYPYGQVSIDAKKIVEQKFKGARGITSQVHRGSVDLNQFNSNRLYSGQTYKKLLDDIRSLRDNPDWLTIFTHDVRDTPSDFGCTPDQLKTVISAIKDIGADIMTAANAIKHLENKHAA